MKRVRNAVGSNQYQNHPGSPAQVAPQLRASIAGAVDTEATPTATPPELCPITWDGSKWSKPRCSHDVCRDRLKVTRALTGAYEPDQAAAWAALGARTVSQCLRLQSIGPPEAIARWYAIGITESHHMRPLEQTGIDPEVVRPWVEIGVMNPLGMIKERITINEARPWVASGVRSPVTIRDAAQQAFTPASFANWRLVAGFADPRYEHSARAVCYIADPSVAAEWQAIRMSDVARKAWFDAGWSPTDVRGWDYLGVGQHEAETLTKFGITPDDIAEFAGVTQSSRRTGVTDGSRQRVRDVIDVTRSSGPDGIEAWSNLKFEPALMLGATAWKVTADDVVEARASGTYTLHIENYAITTTWSAGRTRFSVTGPDGQPVDADLERAAAAFTGDTPEWERRIATARRFAALSVTPGEALGWTRVTDRIDGLRKIVRVTPTVGLAEAADRDTRSKGMMPTQDSRETWSRSIHESERRAHARTSIGLPHSVNS